MSRKLVVVALVAASVLGAAPSAFAARQILCRGDRQVPTTDIEYPWFYRCP
jgi:hypothetical protein